MNKFVIAALFACVGTALAGPFMRDSEVVFRDVNEDIGNVNDDYIKLFTDFCDEINQTPEFQTVLPDDWNTVFTLTKKTAADLSSAKEGSGAENPIARLDSTGSGGEELKRIMKDLKQRQIYEYLQVETKNFCERALNRVFTDYPSRPDMADVLDLEFGSQGSENRPNLLAAFLKNLKASLPTRSCLGSACSN